MLSRQLKVLTFRQLRHQEASDEDALKKLLEEIERLSFLANDPEQTDDVIWSILWKAVEGGPWELHAQNKDGIKFVFSNAVEDFLVPSIIINYTKKIICPEILSFSKKTSLTMLMI